MVIKSLVIENWKSIVHLELKNPNAFSVFVGPNASGKSNIFEALEYYVMQAKYPDVERLFDGPESFLNRKLSADVRVLQILIGTEEKVMPMKTTFKFKDNVYLASNWDAKNFPAYLNGEQNFRLERDEFKQLFKDFSKIFIGNFR